MKPELPRAARTLVAKACVLSRCLYQAGCWPLLSAKQLRAVAAHYHRPFRVILGGNRPPLPGENEISNAEVRAVLRLLPVEWELILRRLQTVARLSGAPPFVSALIRSAGGEQWRLAVRWSLKALQLLLADKFLDMPCPLACPAAWELLWRGTPGAWPRLLALARRRAEDEPSRAHFVLTHFLPREVCGLT
jgi:hypothetical protein